MAGLSSGLVVTIKTKQFERKVRRLKFLLNDSASPAAQLLKKEFNRHIKPEYVRILKAEMGRQKELETLNQGFIIRVGKNIIALPSKRVARKVGSTEGGRFITGQWTPIAKAVEEQQARIDISAPRGILRVGAVNAKEVRDRTLFKWFMRDKRGRFRATGTTEPFGGMWLQTLATGGLVTVPDFGRMLKSAKVTRATRFVGDSGGATVRRRGQNWEWIVQSRTPGKRLHPEKKVWVFKMRKTVKPLYMFHRALFLKTRPLMRSYLPQFARLVRQVAGFAGSK